MAPLKALAKEPAKEPKKEETKVTYLPPTCQLFFFFFSLPFPLTCPHIESGWLLRRMLDFSAVKPPGWQCGGFYFSASW